MRLLLTCALCVIVGFAASWEDTAELRRTVERATSAVAGQIAHELKKWPVIRDLVDFPIPTDRET